MIAVAPATAEDLDDIDAISRASFPAPWPRRAFEDELQRRRGTLDVARDGGRVVGYVNYWLVADEVHLLAIATAPPSRGRGVGERLMARVFDRAQLEGSRLITLEVRAGNVAARRLYERHGFEVVSTRRGYYNNDGEDALIMVCRLDESAGL